MESFIIKQVFKDAECYKIISALLFHVTSCTSRSSGVDKNSRVLLFLSILPEFFQQFLYLFILVGLILVFLDHQKAICFIDVAATVSELCYEHFLHCIKTVIAGENFDLLQFNLLIETGESFCCDRIKNWENIISS